MHVGTGVYVGAHIQIFGEARNQHWASSSVSLHLIFETGSLLKLDLTDSARSAGQQAPGILLYALPQPCSGVTGV